MQKFYFVEFAWPVYKVFGFVLLSSDIQTSFKSRNKTQYSLIQKFLILVFLSSIYFSPSFLELPMLLPSQETCFEKIQTRCFQMNSLVTGRMAFLLVCHQINCLDLWDTLVLRRRMSGKRWMPTGTRSSLGFVRCIFPAQEMTSFYVLIIFLLLLQQSIMFLNSE